MRPAQIILSFPVPLAVICAVDELSLRENVSRGHIALTLIREGLELVLMNHPDLYAAYSDAQKPAQKKPVRRGKVYRFTPQTEAQK